MFREVQAGLQGGDVCCRRVLLRSQLLHLVVEAVAERVDIFQPMVAVRYYSLQSRRGRKIWDKADSISLERLKKGTNRKIFAELYSS